MSHQSTEYVERKGKGHPDTICNSVMEFVSVALAEAYLETAGRVLHFNVDKGLLVAGGTAPKLRDLDSVEVNINTLDQPLYELCSTSIPLSLRADATLADVQQNLNDIVNQELSDVYLLTNRLIRGELPVCCPPNSTE